METRRILSILFLGSCVLMALDGSLLGQEFEQKWWSYQCSQECRHSWETSSLLMVFGYRVLWHRISSLCRRKPEESYPQPWPESYPQPWPEKLKLVSAVKSRERLFNWSK